ncbi:MAG: SurA N-terminal domain-containing protein [Gammaproteobacteria bacterium]
MLQAIRERSQGLVVAIIVGFISLTFALWGVESYISSGRQVIVAEVEGDEILLTEFQDNLQRIRRQAQSALGEAYDDIDWGSAEVKQDALDQVVNERLLTGFIEDAGMRISDLQVARQLQQVPAFQDESGFSRALYEQRLPQLGLSQAGFEQDLRDDMAKSQLRAGIAASEFVTAAEGREIARLRGQKRDIGYAIIPANIYADEVEITDDDIRASFAENEEAYREPERVKLEYIELSPAALEESVVVTEQLLRAHYEANQANYTAQEERNVNHILIQVSEDAAQEVADAALEKAEEALARARDGEAFEELAAEISDDVGSRTEGGETGLFPRGVMAPEFEQAAFELEIGEISEPVRTRFGYHIIKLKEVEPGGLQPFAEVRADVERSYRAAQAQKALFDQAEQFSNLVYEHPDSLGVAADALGLEINDTALLSRDEIAERFSAQVAARAFEPEVLVEGLNAEPVELPDGRILAIRVAEHQPSAIPPLEKVRNEVAQALRAERLAELAETAGEEILEALRGGAAVEDVVASKGLDWQAAAGVDRESDKVNRAVLRASFRTALDGDGPVFFGVPLGKSDYAVVRVSNKRSPAADELEKSAVVEVQRELLQQRAAIVWQEFIDALRASSEVKVFKRNL